MNKFVADVNIVHAESYVLTYMTHVEQRKSVTRELLIDAF